jgi:N-acetylmuramoyl-L-alanine amidase
MRRVLLLLLMFSFLVAGFRAVACAEEETGATSKVKGDKVKKKAKTAGKAKVKGKKGSDKAGKKAKKETRGDAEQPPAAKSPALVKEMRCWSNPDYTRISVTLDHEVSFEHHEIPGSRGAGVPSRLYIDLTGARLAPGVKDLQVGDGLLKTARIAQYRAETVRVVLDLDTIKEYKVFTFADPFSIIIDIRGERRTEISQTKASIQAAPAVVAPPRYEKETEKGKDVALKPGLGKVRRIVVDPGHGGHDPGAQGPNGTREKDVVLQIGLKLARKLREELGLDVVMTRSTDVFLELKERTALANQVGADLFVSIHANAALNHSASGIETYYLNLAKTEKAAQLAAKENGTSLEKVSLLQAVLFDLMANYKLNDSAHLAEEVQKALYRKVSSAYKPVANLGVKQGPFYVLVGATMPSILVETAFVSNEREEGRLKDPDYQETTATGIMEGIRGYISSLK